MYHKETTIKELLPEIKQKFQKELDKLIKQFGDTPFILDYLDINIDVKKIEPVLLPITFENIDGHQQESKYRAWKYFWERKNDLQEYLNLNDDDDAIEKLDELILSADYVEPDTFEDQPDGYYRIQFSWGGPSDELRIYLHDNDTINLIEYIFLDWFIGIGWNVTGDDTFYEFARQAMAMLFDKIVN